MAEFFFVSFMLALIVLFSTVATFLFVRQYRKEQREKLAAKAEQSKVGKE